MARKGLVLLLFAGMAVASCSGAIGSPPQHIVIPETTTPPTSALAANAAPAPAGPTSVPGARGLPVAVDIPSIGVHATHLIALGLIKSGPDKGAPSTPPENTPEVLGYYALGGPPCQPGASAVPFVLIGHIDGDKKLGVFHDLKDLKDGDTVKVGLDNGRSCTYRISKLASFDKANLAKQDPKQAGSDAAQIWGHVPDGEIRVISCGGKFVGAPLFYADNLVGLGTLQN